MPSCRFAWLAVLIALAATPAVADEEDPPGFWERDTLLGDAGGLRPALEKRGITVSLQLTGEGWGNLSGGLRTGTSWGGTALAAVQVDTEKAGLWQGGTFYASGLAIFGQFPGALLVGGLQGPTGNEAASGFTLYEAWYQQGFAFADASVRIGQLRADAEFLTSLYAEDQKFGGAGALMLNASFGFPTAFALAMPAGGPSYPLATPGVRLKLSPRDDVRLLAAVFNGTPARSAFTFRGGMTVMTEAQVLANQGEDATALPGTYRLGVWASNQGFGDQRRDTMNFSLADPLSNGIPRRQSGNWGAYAMADQLLVQTGERRDQAIGVSARLLTTLGDRNAVDSQINLAVTWKGALPGRGDDTAGLGMTLVHHGLGARGFDRDTRFYTDPFAPIRGVEAVFEATYQIQVAGWWQVQPDFQYIMRPSGGAANPARPGTLLRDAVVVGLRSVITF